MARECSEDDLSIWDKFAKNLEPLHVQESANGAPPRSPRDPEIQMDGRAPRSGVDYQFPARRVELAANNRQQKLNARRMDKNVRNKLVKGKIEPASRIDLHGKNRREAEAAVSSFINSSYKKGYRLVLVITGKGRAEYRDEGLAQRAGGVLKTQVARQLSAPPLSECVLEFVHAHRRHGGDGAYYVYLKRRKQD